MSRQGYSMFLVWIAVGVALAVGFVAAPAEAAHCALRHPARQIYEIFPEATNFRTVTGVVDPETVQEIETVSGLELRYSDRGKSTMCVVLGTDAIPVGFVQARSEIGRNGSIEIAWGLDLDLCVNRVLVQRSREPDSDLLLQAEFHGMVFGQSWRGLQDAAERFESSTSAHSRIIGTALDSGVMASLVVSSAFRDEVVEARMEGHARRVFPTGVITDVVPASALSQVLLEGLEPTQTWLGRIVDREGLPLGRVAISKFMRSEEWLDLVIVTSADGVIRHTSSSTKQNLSAASKLRALVGLSRDELPSGPTARFLQHSARELMQLCFATANAR